MNLAFQSPLGGEYLNVLLQDIAEVDDDNNRLISELCLDSREVRPGSLFFAVPGHRDDGRDYIQRAIQAGAQAIIYDSDGWHHRSNLDVPQIGVPNLAAKISSIADVFFKQPSQNLHAGPVHTA